MALVAAGRPRSSPNNENALPAGKSTQSSGLHHGGAIGRAGLKQHQQQHQQYSAATERRILSDISNSRNKPRPSFGTPKPSPNLGFAVLRNENVLPRMPPAAAPPQSAQGKLPAQAQDRAQARVPLRSIVNEALPVPSRQSSDLKKHLSQRRRPGVRVKLTEEQLRQAEEWAKEDLPIEKVHFTEKDAEALRKKLMDEEIEETVNMVRNFRLDMSNACSERKPVKEELHPMYYEDGRLKPDLHVPPYDLALERFAEFDLPVAPDLQLDDVSFSSSFPDDVDRFQYPRVPDEWQNAMDD